MRFFKLLRFGEILRNLGLGLKNFKNSKEFAKATSLKEPMLHDLLFSLLGIQGEFIHQEQINPILKNGILAHAF